jgi:hypothetical protein
MSWPAVHRAVRGRAQMYGTLYGMRRTTIYLPEQLKRGLEQAARSKGSSEATFVREALERAVAEAKPPRPRLPLFSSNEPRLAENVDDALVGFGDS